jgi:hypothetical protein
MRQRSIWSLLKSVEIIAQYLACTSLAFRDLGKSFCASDVTCGRVQLRGWNARTSYNIVNLESIVYFAV